MNENVFLDGFPYFRVFKFLTNIDILSGYLADKSPLKRTKLLFVHPNFIVLKVNV